MTTGAHKEGRVARALQLLLIKVTRLGMSGSVTRYFFDHRDGPDFRDLVSVRGTA
jgi:hypothetical protein